MKVTIENNEVVIRLPLQKPEQTKCFLGGGKYANGAFADWQTVNALVDKLKTTPFMVEMTKEFGQEIETSLNFLALTILRYSASEWGNDYYSAVEALNDIASWLDAWNKHNKCGRYFSL